MLVESSSRDMNSNLLDALGGESGCRELAAHFYRRVGEDKVLKRLFPGKSMRCATEEFASFLVQFFGGDEDQTQYRWWLSLRESHGRFQINADEKNAWLNLMNATLRELALPDPAYDALNELFSHGADYVVSHEAPHPKNIELASRWEEQLQLDELIQAIVAGQDDQVLRIAPRFVRRPSVFIGVSARMMQSNRPSLIAFVTEVVQRDPILAKSRFCNRGLLHFAAGAGCVEVVALLLRLGSNPNLLDGGRHSPLYSLANECKSDTADEVVRLLVESGANINANGGVTRSTALHAAARRGNTRMIASLLGHGADIEAKDSKGHTPLQRAINCRQRSAVRYLLERGASPV